MSESRLLMPSMPLIGVRISWLIVARNCDFILFSSTATTRS